jgi:linoleoyl-CoA desaturase
MQQEKKLPKLDNGSAFVIEARAAVADYFERTGKSPTGDWRLYFKTVFFLGVLFFDYYLIMFGVFVWWVYVILLFVMSFAKAGIGFCIMHDAIHGSYSKYKWVNYVAGLTLNLIGANNTLWKTKHNVIHHTYVNIDTLDDDIKADPLLRLHDEQKYRKIHKYQHKGWYWRTAYSLLLFQWFWWNDYKKYFTRKITYKENIKFSLLNHIVFWLGKIVNVSLFVYFPVVKFGFWYWLLGYVFVVGLTSLFISVVFQLAHVVEGVEHPTIKGMKAKKYNDFFMHQCSTTANFAVNNKFITWFLGGLNFQREHHLFPLVSHVHYPDIRKELIPIYEKYQAPILEYSTVRSAIRAHVGELKRLGKKPKEIPVQL